MEPDFSGWATRAGLKCSDGLTINRGAFQHQDKMQVPLLWQHGHGKPDNVLGHAILEHRDEGVYAYGYFNTTKQGQDAKTYVQHKDIKHLSIFANELAKQGQNVVHGVIREVSLVLAGANPGAVIDFVSVSHGDGSFTDLDDAARIFTDQEIVVEGTAEHSAVSDDTVIPKVEDTPPKAEIEHATDTSKNDDGETIDDLFESLTPKQQEFFHFMIGTAMETAEANAAEKNNAEHSVQPAAGDLIHKEGPDDMTRNVFDQTKADAEGKKHELSHDAMQGIFKAAGKMGSLKAAVEQYAADNLEHGITDIDILFPDAKMATGTIELDKRRTEWVSVVLNGTRHTPFAKIKTFAADLTQDQARAKGYIKGNYKLEEWIGVTKRTTSPTTIYKKQQLDRDDILDITDFDIVTFLKGEMRLMTEEEFARAVLIGDGRLITDEDKVKDPAGAAEGTGIRSIYNDHELFVTTVYVNVGDTNSDYEEVVDAVMDGMEYYKGTGTPTFFTTIPELNKFMKARDLNGQRYYKSRQEVADALGVKQIVTVEPMKEVADLVGIIVNLDDYNVGTDRGGELTMFDDFDIDYNKYKYLMETRASGALLRPKSALMIKKTAAENELVAPVKPSFVASTGVVTIPTVTGVVYKNGAGTTLTAGAQTALAAGASTTVYAVPDTGYYFANNQQDSWPFTRDAA